ncbi:FlmA family RiPP peptide [Sinomicrobium oceani]|uniref:hypothetical protein n=1 Tax=Sinomicrobium oceani TaxID=1150368 RepID=UPI00227A1A90|nr:hypothetical protein [Sinomicrobium oceani]
MNESRKNSIREKFVKKELLKPKKMEDDMVKEVEFLCGELSACNSLRKQKHSNGVDVDVDDDILF